MDQHDFFSVHMIEKKIVNRKTSVDGQKINWLKIRSISLKKDQPYVLFIQQNSLDAPIQRIDIKKSGRNSSKVKEEAIFLMNELLWPNGKPVAAKKLQNLNEMMHLIPSDAINFYKKLVGDENIEEDAECYNVVTLDFDVEYE